MADSPPGSGSGTTAPSNERRLESWGEIASYLRREIRTVQRWERNLGLPIHRLAVGRQSAVFAYPSELDKWYRDRETRLAKEDPEVDTPSFSEDGHPVPGASAPVNGQATHPLPSTVASSTTGKLSSKRLIAGAAFVFVVGLLTAKYGDLLRDAFFPPKVSFPIRLLVRSFNAPAGEQGSDIDAEGFTAELISQLSKVDAARLVVIAPTSALQLRDKTLSELRGTYRVQYVLDGHLQRIGN